MPAHGTFCKKKKKKEQQKKRKINLEDKAYYKCGTRSMISAGQ
jgi:hypothetical protein